MRSAVTSPGPLGRQLHHAGLVALELDDEVLDVENDIGGILEHARQAGELVLDTLDLDRGDGGALERGEQDTTE